MATHEYLSVIASTFKGYLRTVNKHYRVNSYRDPYTSKYKSDADMLLQGQESFEKELARQYPLNVKMIVFMQEQVRENPLGFKAAVCEYMGIGCFVGF